MSGIEGSWNRSFGRQGWWSVGEDSKRTSVPGDFPSSQLALDLAPTTTPFSIQSASTTSARSIAVPSTSGLAPTDLPNPSLHSLAPVSSFLLLVSLRLNHVQGPFLHRRHLAPRLVVASHPPEDLPLPSSRASPLCALQSCSSRRLFLILSLRRVLTDRTRTDVTSLFHTVYPIPREALSTSPGLPSLARCLPSETECSRVGHQGARGARDWRVRPGSADTQGASCSPRLRAGAREPWGLGLIRLSSMTSSSGPP